MDNKRALADLDSDADALSPLRSFGYRIWMLRHAWTRRIEVVLAPTALTHMQFFVLCGVERLTQVGEAPSQTRIAGGMHADCMTVSKVVRALEAKKLLVRAVHPDDPRAKCVALTPLGAEMVRHGTRLVRAEQDRFFGRLGRVGQAAFSEMLDALLREDAAAGGPGPETRPAAGRHPDKPCADNRRPDKEFT